MVYLAISKPNKRSIGEQRAEGTRLLGALLSEAGERPDLELSRDENVRPYIIGRKDLDLSLSHSEMLVACVLSVGEGRVGVDTEPLEPTVPADRRICFAKRYFSEREIGRLYGNALEFSRIWTGKEAILKREGIGLSAPLAQTDTLDLPDDVRLVTVETEGHAVTVCLKKDAELKIIK